MAPPRESSARVVSRSGPGIVIADAAIVEERCAALVCFALQEREKVNCSIGSAAADEPLADNATDRE